MQGNSSGTRKSSKWDQMTVEAVKPSVAAAEVAAKLNAKLAAEGKLIQSTPPQLPPTSATSSSVLASVSGASKGQQQACGFFTAEVDINNCLARSELIKTTTLTEINRATGAFVSVRGKYMSMEEQKDGNQTERLQYLHVQSTTQERVNNAVDRIKGIIAGETTNKQFSNQQQHYVQDKVFIGMDQAPESFKLLDRLSGPGGSYLAHIADQTGAKVYLRGKGSGFLEPTSGREAFEALYLYISHPTHNGMTQAKKLCESLVSTVRKELQQFTAPLGYATIPPPPPPAVGPAAAAAGGGAYTYMQQPPFYASFQMGSHDPRMLPPQQYGGQPFPIANPPSQGAGMTAPPFPPYFGAMPPYIGAPPPQPFVASSVPPHPYAVPPQTGPIPPLLPTAVTSTQSETTSATGEYPVSSADSNKAGSSNNVYTLAQSPANTSTGESLLSPAPSKPAKRRFTEKPNIQAEVLKSSLSVNAYTDVSREATQSVDDVLGNSHQDRVANQESKEDESDAEVKTAETKEYKLINTDEKSEPYIKKDYDKWKPIIDASEKDKMLMPPPGSFPRLPTGQRMLPKQKEFVKPKQNEPLKSEEDESLKDEDDSNPTKKLKLVVYGDSDSDD